MLPKKIASVMIYFLLWLGCFQLKDALVLHTNSIIERVFFCLFAGFVFAYMNGFVLFKIPTKNKQGKDNLNNHDK